MSGMMSIGEVILGRYEVEDLICDGGQATLAKGIDRQTGQPVAIKRLSADPGQSNYHEELARFQRAGRMRIGHPVVVDPIDCGEEDGQWYMVMPFIEGVTLEQYVTARGGRLPTDQAVGIILGMASGVGAIHKRGTVHRDLKPANIIIDPQGCPRIVDLGICRVVGEATITQGSRLLGTIHWMSPEQVRKPGGEDHRSDLYSLGAIFYYILTGLLPVQGNDPVAIALSICQSVLPGPRSVVQGIPDPVSSACMKLMAKRREDRFQTAEGFIQALAGQPETAGQGRFCPSCGISVGRGARYCATCGAELGAPSSDLRCLACGAEAGEANACPKCRRPFVSDHRLLFNTGTLTGKTFRIPEGTYVVGREELSRRDPHISRRHFQVQCLNGSVFVEDVGSTNKTFVAGQLADGLNPLVDGMEFGLAGNAATYTCNQERIMP